MCLVSTDLGMRIGLLYVNVEWATRQGLVHYPDGGRSAGSTIWSSEMLELVIDVLAGSV